MSKEDFAFDAKNWDKALPLFQELEFKSLIKDIDTQQSIDQGVQQSIAQKMAHYDFITVTTPDQLLNLVSLLKHMFNEDVGYEERRQATSDFFAYLDSLRNTTYSTQLQTQNKTQANMLYFGKNPGAVPKNVQELAEKIGSTYYIEFSIDKVKITK